MKATDGRKKNGGARVGAGRKRGIGMANDIKKHCQRFIEEMLLNDAIRLKATKQLSLQLDAKEDIDYLYIIENNGNYKIGYSSDWGKRRKVYKTHMGDINLVYLTKQTGCFELENHLHSIFKDKRVEGEWFDLDETDVLEAISYCSKQIK